MNRNLLSIVERGIEDGSSAFMFRADGGIISYADAFEESGRIANLLSGLGVKPGDRIAAQVEKSPQALLLYLGALRAGAVYLPLNAACTGNELEHFLKDSRPTAFVCDPPRKPEAEKIARQAGIKAVETLDENGKGSFAEKASASSSSFEAVERSGDDLAALLYTSGTTGKPKGAMITHENLASNAKALRDEWRFSKEDVLLHALPIFHTHGLFVAANVTLISGASMILLPKFDPDEIVKRLRNATVMMGVPTFYSRLLNHSAFTKESASRVRLFVSGSAPLSPETHREFAGKIGHSILERYGMTETNMNSSNPYDGERKAGTVGFPLPGVEIRICDPESGRPLERGGIGMIEVRGPNVFKGYWGLPGKTAEEFRDDGYFITGDLGMFDDSGYLRIAGRNKDLVISGGYNVYPAEVEAALDAVAGVSESAVIGAPHSDLGEGVVAVVALRDGAKLSSEEVIASLSGEIARYKTPRQVFFVDALPRNRMGKVEKKLLRERYANAFAQGESATR